MTVEEALLAIQCPAGGWNGQPKEIERATVADCLKHGVCGCIYGDSVKEIKRLQAEVETWRKHYAEIVVRAAYQVAKHP